MPVYTTAGDMILTALKLMGIEAAGETSTSEDLNDGLIFLNLLLDEWSIDRGKIFARVEDTLTLTVGTGDYTIGIDPAGLLTADISTTAPVSIEQGYLRNTALVPAIDYPLNVHMLQEEYNAMPLKSITTIPTRLFAIKGVPFWTLYLDFLPIYDYEMHLFSWKSLTKIDAITTELSFPDGYEAALTYNLAVAFASAFGTQAAPDIKARAVMLASKISDRNYEIPKIQLRGVPGSNNRGQGGSIYNPFLRG